jgi:ribosomal protein S27AE
MKDKKCFKCGKVKSLDEFYKHPRMKDGHLGKCKECTKKDVAEDRINNPEKLKARDKKRNGLPHRVKERKKYAQSPQGKKAKSKATKKWTEKNPLKKAVYRIFKSAIKTGRLKRQPCEKCGSTIRVHGHHDDYYKPLEVRWLCSKCHAKLHREIENSRKLDI